MISSKIIFSNDSNNSFETISRKPCFSNELTLKLVELSLLDKGFKDANNNFVLGEIHDGIIAKSEDAVATFIFWFKPRKKEDYKVSCLASGTIVSIIIEGNCIKCGEQSQGGGGHPDGTGSEKGRSGGECQKTN